ncbi:hypothetical protein MLD38_030774 [Melastoma candidum]|uniref:Uncharacterized protein n=1 Tax=Melastoma candidum TaxID=119954 RepID=A0ACB9MPK5_9MYRT|nr:hypothetical protein MLD38_030774 [Melastoma candidum]
MQQQQGEVASGISPVSGFQEDIGAKHLQGAVEVEIGSVYNILCTEVMELYSHGGIYRISSRCRPCWLSLVPRSGLVICDDLNSPGQCESRMTEVELWHQLENELYTEQTVKSWTWRRRSEKKRKPLQWQRHLNETYAKYSTLRKLLARFQHLKGLLLSFCIKDKPQFYYGLLKSLNATEKIGKYPNTSHEVAITHMKGHYPRTCILLSCLPGCCHTTLCVNGFDGRSSLSSSRLSPSQDNSITNFSKSDPRPTSWDSSSIR